MLRVKGSLYIDINITLAFVAIEFFWVMEWKMQMLLDCIRQAETGMALFPGAQHFRQVFTRVSP